MTQNHNDQTEIEPLDHVALEDVAGGSTGKCCSCVSCSHPRPPGDEEIVMGPE